MKPQKTPPLVSIVMGSDSDYPVMKDAERALKEFRVSYEKKILSAHRTPKEMTRYAELAKAKGIRVIIAGAGGAAHLPGMMASFTELPVIGVPVPHGKLSGLDGIDALLSIAQMPKGVPVATMAIANAYNAGLFAVQIIAAGGERPHQDLLTKLNRYKQALRKKVLKKKLPS